jgi:hypothetical protein
MKSWLLRLLRDIYAERPTKAHEVLVILPSL